MLPIHVWSRHESVFKMRASHHCHRSYTFTHSDDLVSFPLLNKMWSVFLKKNIKSFPLDISRSVHRKKTRWLSSVFNGFLTNSKIISSKKKGFIRYRDHKLLGSHLGKWPYMVRCQKQYIGGISQANMSHLSVKNNQNWWVKFLVRDKWQINLW